MGRSFRGPSWYRQFSLGPPIKLTVPEKPAIAVLPFANLSRDTEQEYFSDGITEDIIAELSRFHSLFVIARNSSFRFKGSNASSGEIGTADICGK